MNIHFQSRNEATAHLALKGWSKISNGRWISRDKLCAAHILNGFGAAVLIQVWEI